MPNQCCCDLCSCIGCVSIQVSGFVVSIDADLETIVKDAYEGRVTFHNKKRSTRSPFDLIVNGGATLDCTDAMEAYPGTKCEFVADICCNPYTTPDLPDPPIPDPDPDPDPDPPPPPPPPPPPIP